MPTITLYSGEDKKHRNGETEEHTEYMPVNCEDYKLLICLDLKGK